MDKQQKKALKAKAHHLKPVVIIGQQGLTDAVQLEIGTAFAAHELIKVKVAGSDKADLQEAADAICAHHEADHVGSIGHILILYKQRID